MTIQKQIVPISFAGGLDGKTDPKQVLPTKLLELQNGILTQAGAVSKRWGYRALGKTVLGTSTTIAACYGLHAFEDELLLYDGLAAYSYSPARDAWISRGEFISIVQTNTQIVRNGAQQLSPDSTSLNGVTVYAWEDSRGGIRYSVADATTGTLLVVDQPLFSTMPSTVVRPKTIALGSQILVLYSTATGQIAYVPINPSNPTAQAVAGVTLLTTASPSATFFDATVSGSQLLIAYEFLGASPSLHVAAFNSVPQLVWDNTVAAGPFPSCSPSVVGDASGNAWVTYPNGGSSSTSCATALYAPGGARTLAPVTTITQSTGTVAAITGIVSGTTLTIYAEATAASSFNEVIYTSTLTLAGAASATSVFLRSVGLASKAFAYEGAPYVNVAFQSPLQSTYFTVGATGHVVAKASAGLGGGLVSGSDFVLPEVTQVSAGIYLYANLIKGLPNTEAGQVLALLGVNETELDFADSTHFLSASINGGLYTVGGVLQSYDGAQYVEHGFHVYPESFIATPIGSGGALGTGTYNYCVTYEWEDNNGLTQISTPSVAVPVTFATGSSNSVQLTIPTLRLTRKTNVRIVVYRTAANGLTMTRVTSALVPLYNNPAVDTVTFLDVLSDASIAGNGAMYTQPLVTGGNPILPNSAPPACSLITTYADRVWIAGPDSPYTLSYTQQSALNVPMQFAAQLTLTVDPDGGPISALARMDEKLVIFKPSGVFYLIGQGPTATGDQNDFGDPVQVPSGSVGCANPNSVVLTPMGLLFASANGIYLFDRNLNVSYKGAPVEPFNALSITSATLIPNQWVVFTTTTGTALVYDYYFDQWSTFTNHVAVDSKLYLGEANAFVYGNPSGQVYLQTPTTFSDAGAVIPLELTTAWINPGAIQGYMRVYHALVLGTYKGSHTLNVWAGFDYDDPFVELAQIPTASTLGISTFGSSSPFGAGSPFGDASPGQTVYQFRCDVLRKCEAIRFKIGDVESTPTEALGLSALTLVVGVKTGAMKFPGAKIIGMQ